MSSSFMNGLSLFANVGIAETYLKELGFQVKVANELLPARAKFYEHSHPDCHMICGDITEEEIFSQVIKKARKEKVQFILATPPCQGMSQAGKMQEDDPRNSLILRVIKAIQELSPQYVLIENVPQMLKTSIKVDGKVIKITDYINSQCAKDYNICFDVFDAADYGTAQYRKRAIVRFSKKPNVWNNPEKQKQITVKEKISHLPSLESGQKSSVEFHKAKIHNANHQLWMKHTPTGKSAMFNKVHYPVKDNRKIKGYNTTYKRMEWDRPAPTITMANGSISSQNNVHPGRLLPDGTYSDARVLTLKELFLLTGLPESWAPPIWASENLVRQVIGEAVPPMLVKSIFEKIKP